MGNCLKPLKKATTNEPAAVAKNRAGHMGPDGVENSIFSGTGGIDYAAESAGASRVKTPPQNGEDPNNVQLTVEMGPLDDLGARTRAAGVNGSVPPPGVGMPGHDPNGGGAPAAGAPGAGPQGPQGEQPKPKQAVMRRSFPPVGVLLQFDRTAEQIPALQGLPDMTDAIAVELAANMEFGKDRIRVMFTRAGSKEVKLNIVADRTDVDARSPMQLAAMLVQQASNKESKLRQQPISKYFARADIAEDPFPGTKQDSWAGGVAMLRPPSPKGDKPKKKKGTAAAERAAAAAAAAGQQPAPPQEGPSGGGNVPLPDIPGIGPGDGGAKRKSKEEKLAAAAVDVILGAPSRTRSSRYDPALGAAAEDAAEALLGKPVERKSSKNYSKTSTPRALSRTGSNTGGAMKENIDPELLAAAKNTSELPGGSLVKEGGIYAGEIVGGKRHGRGKQNYKNGDVYVGCFKDDKRSGIGRLTLSGDAGTYLGEWDENERNGKGSWTYPNKDVYVGAWKDGKRSGEGRLVMSSGAWYKGEFKDDVYHGTGQMQFENKDMYEGQFAEGKMHGQGTFTPAATGAAESGVWNMGQRSQGGAGHPKKGLGTVIVDDLQDESQKPHAAPVPPQPTQEFKPPPNPGPPAQHPGARGQASTQRAGSIKDAKPPVRSVRSGASMKTDDTLKMVSDRLSKWVTEEGGDE
mmetsp:Transcript_53129/g.125546  ORF Transcript_53129/g.125546 Transcript_53129/m.125546 type:complete len:688 (-) Transcript_53129:460-2523(-)